MPDSVTLCVERHDPFIIYAIELSSAFLGIRISIASESVGDIAYGKARGKHRIPEVGTYAKDTVPRSAPDSKAHDDFPFDYFAALRFWLADEDSGNQFDAHDRLIGSKSTHDELGTRTVPIVNAYIRSFGDWLEANLNVKTKSILPEGKQCALVLSHDVDNPIDPTDIGHYTAIGLKNILRRPGQGKFFLRQARLFWRDRQKWDGDRHWLFEEIMREENRRGMASTFFFSSTPRYLENAHDQFDVWYDVSLPRFRTLFPNIRKSGSEVGLHISYNAHKDIRLLKEEKSRLESICGYEITSSRHHFWRMQRPFWPTLEDHGGAGLKLDMSVSFNDVPGYRLGVAFPFFPWNPQRKTCVKTLQVPTMVMDGSLFRTAETTVSEVLLEFEALLDSLKRHQGIAAIDWHARTSFPASKQYRKWGEAYIGILDILANDPAVLVMDTKQVREAVGKAYSLSSPF